MVVSGIYIIVSILFKVTSTSFAMANVATTNEYVNMSRTSGKSITKSKKQKALAFLLHLRR